MGVLLMPGVRLGEVVNLAVLGPFVPGMTLDKVSLRHGQPKASRTDWAGTYYEYSHHGTRIEVGHERSFSGDAIFERWVVCAYPTPQQSSELLIAPLAKLIESEEASEVILTGSGDPMVSLRIDQGRVAMIRWYGVQTGDSRTQGP